VLPWRRVGRGRLVVGRQAADHALATTLGERNVLAIDTLGARSNGTHRNPAVVRTHEPAQAICGTLVSTGRAVTSGGSGLGRWGSRGRWLRGGRWRRGVDGRLLWLGRRSRRRDVGRGLRDLWVFLRRAGVLFNRRLWLRSRGRLWLRCRLKSHVSD